MKFQISSSVFHTQSFFVSHLDCAKVYGNEILVGKAIKESKIKREEIFITSKIWNDDKHPDNVEKAIRLTLKRLDLSYLNLDWNL